MATKDLFCIDESNAQDIGGGFRFSNTQVLMFNDQNESFVGFVIQNLRAQYRQPVTRLRGMNTKFVYMLVGPPEGSMGLGTVIGNPTSTESFLCTLADPCNLMTNNLSFTGPKGCDTNKYGSGNTASGRQKLTAKGCLLGDADFTTDVQNLMLAMNVQIQFIRLDMDTPIT
jgi:hypothetical protein